MKINELTILYVIFHFLADYYFQCQKLADLKETEQKAVLCHTHIYSLTMLGLSLALTLLGGHWHLILAGVIISASHMLVDIIKFGLQKKYVDSLQPGTKMAAVFYLADQAIHLLVIVLLIEFFSIGQSGIPLLLHIPRNNFKWALLLILNAKPANISFKKLFKKYMVDEDPAAPNNPECPPQKLPEPGAGALIGIFERFLSILFIHLGQFAAIGLIYTAKSIARLEKIGKDPRFAEYYLIGTLYSILFVLVSYLFIFRMMI